MDVTPTGDVVTVGTMAGTVDFGPGGKVAAQSESDLYVAWLGKDGAIQKARSFGGGGTFRAFGARGRRLGGDPTFGFRGGRH